MEEINDRRKGIKIVILRREMLYTTLTFHFYLTMLMWNGVVALVKKTKKNLMTIRLCHVSIVGYWCSI